MFLLLFRINTLSTNITVLVLGSERQGHSSDVVGLGWPVSVRCCEWHERCKPKFKHLVKNFKTYFNHADRMALAEGRSC